MTLPARNWHFNDPIEKVGKSWNAKNMISKMNYYYKRDQTKA